MITKILCLLGLHYCPTKQFKDHSPNAFNGNVWLYGSCKTIRLKNCKSYCIYCGKRNNNTSTN